MEANLTINLSATEQQFLSKNQASLNQLLTYLKFVKGFNLSIVEFKFHHDLETIIQTITNHAQTINIQFWILNLDDPNLRFFRDEMVKRLTDLTIETDKKLIIIVEGLENAIGVQGEKSPFLADLNYIRDILPRDIPYPMIFCLPTYAVNSLAKFAPDIWSWMSVITFETFENPNIQRPNLTNYSPIEFEETIPADNQDRIDFLRERLAEYYQSNDDSVKESFYLLSQLGIAYRQQKEFAQAETYLPQAEALFKENQSLISLSEQANVYDNLGKLYESKFIFPKAISYYQLALALFQKIRDYHGQENCLINLGNAYNYLGEYHKAIDFYQQSLNIAKEIGDRQGEGVSLNNRGNLYYSLGEYHKAIDFYQQSLNISKEIGDRKGEGNSLGHLGNVYYSLEEYEKAINLLQQSVNISKEIGDLHGEGNSLGNLGNAYDSLGESKKAIDFLQQSVKIAKEIGDRRSEGIFLGNLGITFFKQEKYEDALQCIQEAIEILATIGYRNGEAHFLKNLAEIYKRLGNFDLAMKYCEQALNLARELSIPLVKECEELKANLEKSEI